MTPFMSNTDIAFCAQALAAQKRYERMMHPHVDQIAGARAVFDNQPWRRELAQREPHPSPTR